MFQIRAIPEDGEMRWKVAGCHASAGGGITVAGKRNPEGFFTRYFGVAEDRETVDLRVGVANGPWRTVAQTGPSAAALSGPGGKSLVFSAAVLTGEGTVIVVSHDFLDQNFRVIAVDKQGKTHSSVRRGGVRSGGIYQTQPTFPGLAPEQVERFEFQVRDWEWIEIPNLPLQPRGEQAD